jgi:hypothetical protein
MSPNALLHGPETPTQPSREITPGQIVFPHTVLTIAAYFHQKIPYK